MNMELYDEITQFYYRAAHLLDSRRFDEWLELFTDDAVYRMPLRVTAGFGEGPGIMNQMSVFDESKQSLAARVMRLKLPNNWAENPAPRTRHFVSNILIESEASNGSELNIRSNFSFTFCRGENPQIEQPVGERIDILRKAGDQWKICSRTIIPDQEVFSVPHIGVFF